MHGKASWVENSCCWPHLLCSCQLRMCQLQLLPMFTLCCATYQILWPEAALLALPASHQYLAIFVSFTRRNTIFKPFWIVPAG